MRINLYTILTFLTVLLALGCESNDDVEEPVVEVISAVSRVFEGRIDVNNLDNYANQDIPDYIIDDNSGGNPITDEGATLGRVLFYDVNLSVDNTISCSSCHQQENAFGDGRLLSEGVNGTTGRHSMRLVNSRFGNERRFFWDERANSLEDQTTMPIADHVEMGFSGVDGDPNFQDLITKMNDLDYYNELFSLAFGDSEISETRIQLALAQFIRSIQSFDSKYDAGLVEAGNENEVFANYDMLENQGKMLFMTTANRGGAGCNSCHSAPEFDIDPNSGNNGITTTANNQLEMDFSVTRSPSLRDLFNRQGELNGPLMHDGSLKTLLDVVNHYDEIQINPENTNLDNRLRRPGTGGQNLQLTETEKEALIAFVMTLSGTNIYNDDKWSNPFTPEN